MLPMSYHFQLNCLTDYIRRFLLERKLLTRAFWTYMQYTSHVHCKAAHDFVLQYINQNMRSVVRNLCQISIPTLFDTEVRSSGIHYNKRYMSQHDDLGFVPLYRND
jgi:hypothetical protein